MHQTRYRRQPEVRFSRRTFGGAALMTALFAGIANRNPARAAIDIEPARTSFYRLLAQTPVRPGGNGAAFPVTSLADFTMMEADRAQTSVMPGLPVSDAMIANWIDLFGFHPDRIEVIAAQDEAIGFMTMIRGTFSFEEIEQCAVIWREYGYTTGEDERDPFRLFQFPGNPAFLADQFPNLPGIAEGHYRQLAFLDNATLVMAAKQDAIDAARLAIHRDVPTMEFAPGASGFLRHEPPNVFEAIILPGSIFWQALPDATPVASDGAIKGLLGVVGARSWAAPKPENGSDHGPLREFWYLVVTVDRVNIDDTDSGELYAQIVQEQFAHATSRTLNRSFPEIMSLDRVEVIYSTVIFTFTPLTDDPHDIIHFARNDDLDFLIPPNQ